MLVAVLLTLGTTAWWVERRGRRPLAADETFDAIVVPGARVMPDGQPSSTFSRRIRLAIELFWQGRAPALVFCGGVGESPFAESEVARDMAVAAGVPREVTFTERLSTSTETNARHAAAAFPGASQASVLVVTDAFHVVRARRVFARYFGQARGIGTVHPSIKLRAKGAVREVGAMVGYAVLGRL